MFAHLFAIALNYLGPMTTSDLFKTLTPEEFEKVETPSPEEIREALKKAEETFRKITNRHPGLPRYR